MSEDPESNLAQWKETMQAEHEAAIAEPDPDEDHRIEGVSQVSYRVYFDYDAERDSLERVRREQVDELADPELLACDCGVRGMTPEEATEHMRAAREG
jgi:CheY-like chemotaxis protein